jgi:hypothetical protein
MKNFLVILAMLAPLLGNAEVHIAEWGVAETFDFKLYNADGTLDVDEVDSGTEVAIACDEGAETTATNDFADEGNFYSIALTAAELQCARATVVVAVTVTEAFFVETVGHPDAQLPCPNGECVTTGTMQASTAGTAVLAAATSFANDYLVGSLIEIVAGTGSGQEGVIAGWVSTTDTATMLEDWTTTPDTTSKYRVIRDKRGLLEIDANGYVSSNVQTLVGAAITALQSGLATLTGQTTITDAITDLTDGTTPVTVDDISTGTIQAADFAAGAIDATALAADAGTEIAAAVGALVIETQGVTYTLSCSQAVLLAMAAGEVSTTAGVSTFQDPGGNATRMVGTVTGGVRDTITITCP